MDAKQQVETMLDNAIHRAERRGNRYGRLAWTCYMLAFFSGVAAALITISGVSGKSIWIPAALAVAPSFCLAALTTFNLTAWAQWELDRAFIVRSIERRMPYASDDEVILLVDEWNARDAELRLKKPSFGPFSLPTKPSQN